MGAYSMWVELKMEKDFIFKLLFVVLFLGVFVDCGFCLEDADSDAVVYIVTLKQAPVSHLYGEELRVKGHHNHNSKNHGSGNVSRLDKPRYLMIVVSGGMNQQRNQIVDVVVIARILGAALVVPILQVNVIWGDESEFSDIFDWEHFKEVLANDVRIVSSLPPTHVITRPVEEKRTPFHVSPE